ncbi:MAG: hypothetical protein ACRDF4_06640 [Rhabdochlamydiaceae bacterium]
MEVEYEFYSYLESIRSQICSPEEEAELLNNFPEALCVWMNILQEEILDPTYESATVVIAPMSHTRVIEVLNTRDGLIWRLRRGKDIRRFIRERRHLTQMFEPQLKQDSERSEQGYV